MSRAKSGGILALLAAMTVGSCVAPEEETPPPSPPIGSIIGVWTITETPVTISNPTCNPPSTTYLLYVAQSGNTIIAQTGFDITPPLPLDPTLGSDGAQFNGTLSGSTLGVQGLNPFGVGTLQTATAATVTPSCNFLSGARTLSYSGLGGPCTGTLSLTGSRLVGNGCTGTLVAAAVTESSMPHNTAAVAQTVTRPAAVSGTIANGEEDWYSFSLGALNEPVTILLDGPAAPQKIDLFLTDNAGTLMLAQSTSSSSRQAVGNSLAGNATYKIRVIATAVTGTASYTLLAQ
jgi:hypothetical protein